MFKVILKLFFPQRIKQAFKSLFLKAKTTTKKENKAFWYSNGHTFITSYIVIQLSLYLTLPEVTQNETNNQPARWL